MLHRIWLTAVDEFSDLGDVEHLTRVALRLFVAAALGAAIGWEREAKQKSAGLRTHMLVALGAALFVLVPEQAGAEMEDVARVIHGVIAGIGFLGAGAIIKRVDTEETKGMTTAASIWMTAAIGVAAGLGREATALLSTLLTLAVLSALPMLERRLAAPGAARDPDDPSEPRDGVR